MQRRLAMLAAVLLLASVAVPRRDATPPGPVGPGGAPPVELDDDAGDGERGPSRLQAWLDRSHAAPDGADWRTLDARTRATLAPTRRAARRAGAKVQLAAGVTGAWAERGATNQAGRVVATDYDAATDRFYAFAHGGTIWSRSRAVPDWTVHNDTHALRPTYLLGALSVLRTPGLPLRLLVGAGRASAVSYSDDGGATWTAARGLVAEAIDVQHLVVRGGSAGHVYLTQTEFDSVRLDTHTALYASVDRGASFVRVARLGGGRPIGLFAPFERSDDVFVLVDGVLSRIDAASHQLQQVGVVPVDFDLGATRHEILVGGVTPAGQTFLYAFFRYDAPNDTRVYRSLDGGVTWTQRSTLPSGQFTVQSLGASRRDPDVALGGGVNAYRTADGGATWQLVNEWYEYNVSPATKLHADITEVRPWIDPAGVEHFLVSTDGGVYDTSDGGATVRNLSLGGLRNSEYYGSYTVRTGARTIVAGAQDQGWQKALDGGASGRFEQPFSGDYGSLVSGDDGATLWAVYPGFVLHDDAPAQAASQLRAWDFRSHGIEVVPFLASLAVAGNDPHAVWLGGMATRERGSYLYELRWSPETDIVGRELPFRFDVPVTAIATDPFDPSTRYVTTNELLYRTRDAGQSFELLPAQAPLSSGYYGVIRPDPGRPGRLYLGGNNYAGVGGVAVSDDYGATVAPLVRGLPRTYVYDLALSRDGEHLFAATEVGAFHYDRAAQAWRDITLGAPDQAYWSVQFLEESRTARFATYGRGIWDFTLDGNAPPIRQHGLTGLWYDAGTPGQGIALEVFESTGLVFASWYTYDVAPAGDAARQRWYSLQATVGPTDRTASMTILRNVGGNFDAPPATAPEAVGSATLAFADCTTATLHYAFDDGRTGTLDLRRLLPDATCSLQVPAQSRLLSDPGFLLSGHWYQPALSGQGYGIELNTAASLLFVSWFTYAGEGDANAGATRQRWYTIQVAAAPGQRTFAGAPVFATTGGVFDRPDVPSTRQVGTATVDFASCSRVVVTHTIDGAPARTATLDRIGPAPAGCTF